MGGQFRDVFYLRPHIIAETAHSMPIPRRRVSPHLNEATKRIILGNAADTAELRGLRDLLEVP